MNKGLARLGGYSLIGAAVALVLQLAFIYPANSALVANTSTQILSIGSVSYWYGAFISAIVALDLFGIIAFGVWYLILKNVNLAGALGALLLGVVALTIDLTVDLPLRFSEISAAGEYAASTSEIQRTAIAAVFQFMLDFSNDSLMFSTFILGLAFLFLAYAMLHERMLFGSRLSFLSLGTGVLIVAEVPLAIPSNPTGFLGVYLAATVVQIFFFALVGLRMLRV